MCNTLGWVCNHCRYRYGRPCYTGPHPHPRSTTREPRLPTRPSPAHPRRAPSAPRIPSGVRGPDGRRARHPPAVRRPMPGRASLRRSCGVVCCDPSTSQRAMQDARGAQHRPAHRRGPRARRSGDQGREPHPLVDVEGVTPCRGSRARMDSSGQPRPHAAPAVGVSSERGATIAGDATTTASMAYHWRPLQPTSTTRTGALRVDHHGLAAELVLVARVGGRSWWCWRGSTWCLDGFAAGAA